jgi:hypothetical protein
MLDGHLSSGGGGVACSIVKSNTNIYYNSKVDTATSKAIHYCNHCTNPNCKAIHKSLTKPLIAHSQPLQLSSTPSLSTSLLSPTNPNRSNSSNSSSSSSTRIFLSPNNNQTLSSSISSPSINNQSSHNNANTNNNQFNKLLGGANINFIFERRYPLVQLNSSLFNATNALHSPSSPTNEASSLTSALNQLATQTPTNHHHNHHHHHLNHSTRHPLRYGGSSGVHRLTSSPSSTQSLLNDENSSSMSPPTTPTPQSFPLPFSPQLNLNNDYVGKQPPSFSINLNRLLATPSSSINSQTTTNNINNNNNNNNSNNRRQLLNTQNQQLLQQLNEAIDQQGLGDILRKNLFSGSNESTKPLANSLQPQQQLQQSPSNLASEENDDAPNSPTSMFPFNMNNLNLRYKNIMFLDQVNLRENFFFLFFC